MSAPVGLIETLRAERGAVPLLARHLARLSSSAAALGIPLDRARTEANLVEAAARADATARLRLELAPDGSFEVTLTPLAPLPERPAVVLARSRLDSSDPLLRHKTTRRALYDAERTRLADVEDGFDVIFLNERGEVCEGAISNVFAETGGVWATPPVASGLLPGVMRAEVMRERGAVERVLTLADLKAAGRVVLTNAVRGEVPVSVVFDQAPSGR